MESSAHSREDSYASQEYIFSAWEILPGQESGPSSPFCVTEAPPWCSPSRFARPTRIASSRAISPSGLPTLEIRPAEHLFRKNSMPRTASLRLHGAMPWTQYTWPPPIPPRRPTGLESIRDCLLIRGGIVWTALLDDVAGPASDRRTI